MPSRSRKAARPKLTGLLQRSVEDTLSTFTAAAEEYEEAPCGDQLHDVRVALRRASAVSALFHGFPGKRDGARVEEIAHELRRTLSPAREREVSAGLVRGLSGEDTAPTRQALAALDLAAGADAPAIAAAAESFAASLRTWRDALAIWKPDAGDEERLRRKVKRRLKRERRRVLELRSPGKRTLHRLRVAAKALRYALELVAGVEVRAGELVKACRRFQDALGDANDWATLHQKVRDARSAAAGEARETIDLLAPRVEEQRARAFGQAKKEARRFLRFLELRPIALVPPAPARVRSAPRA
jgi:CHAD domain-containing protein